MRIIGALLIESKYNSIVKIEQDSIITNQIQIINHYIEIDSLNTKLISNLRTELTASQLHISKLETHCSWLKPLLYLSIGEAITILLITL